MSSVEELVSRQVRFYRVQRQLEEETVQPASPKHSAVIPYGPYLLLSHEVGSSEEEVANTVGRLLDWRVFDREIVDQIAQNARARRQLVESLDEHDRSMIEDMVTSALSHELGRREYFAHLKQVMHTLGRQGQVIIIGRGARHILPVKFGLSVRLVAPLELRTRNFATAHGLSPDAARQAVTRGDHERNTFIRTHFHCEASDPLSHDLTLNTGELGVETTSNIILTALRQKLGALVALP